MIEGLKPYPNMKDSGVPWCPHVPAHWDLVPNRAFLSQRKVLVGDRHPEYTLLSLTKQGIIIRDISENKGKFSADMGTSQEVRENDLVMCLFDVPETPRTVGLSRHKGMITSAYTVFQCRDSDVARWLESFYICMDDRKLLSPLYSGLRHTIPKPRFLSTHTPLPSSPERIAIHRFLSHADRHIRRLIRSKRDLLSSLYEQQQSIARNAITRGLGSASRLVETGIPWIGAIPEHWSVKRIKYLMHPIDRRSSTGNEVLLSMRKHHGLVPYHEHFTKPPQAATLKGFKIVKAGQVVVNRMQAGFGLIFASRYDGLVSPDFGVFAPTGEVEPEFLGEIFRSRDIRAQFQRESKGLGTGKSGFMRLYDDRIGIVAVAYPPSRDEQHRILSRLHESVANIDKAIQITRKEISTLIEYGQNLSAHVVTGTLDVREAAARLPADDLQGDDAADDTDTDGEEDDDSPIESGAEDGDGG